MVLINFMDLIQLAKINGKLEAFAYLNDFPDNGHTFELVELDNNLSNQHAVENYLLPLSNSAATDTVTLDSPLVNMFDELKIVLCRWCIDYIVSKTTEIKNEGEWVCNLNIYSNWEPKYFVENIVDEIDSMIQIQSVIPVQFSSKSWYEAYWEDFLIIGKTGKLFLHLGVSD